MARKISAHQSKTWKKDVTRMVAALDKLADPEEASVYTLRRFKKYSEGTKAAVVANWTRGSY